MYHNIYREPGAHVASLALRLVGSDALKYLHLSPSRNHPSKARARRLERLGSSAGHYRHKPISLPPVLGAADGRPTLTQSFVYKLQRTWQSVDSAMASESRVTKRKHHACAHRSTSPSSLSTVEEPAFHLPYASTDMTFTASNSCHNRSTPNLPHGTQTKTSSSGFHSSHPSHSAPPAATRMFPVTLQSPSSGIVPAMPDQRALVNPSSPWGVTRGQPSKLCPNISQTSGSDVLWSLLGRVRIASAGRCATPGPA
ncbi:hypothetical protein RRG08_024440 [Elysia crispata]|uniref:Uncharacterized protein n=1 Tax=Elysia crispata TaxID=231223 RepID=A0AAE1D2Z3_9GAST|nr:hypothetical protein RRG08_024440 [Elysia crispata]